jgi:hypothetical protein
MSSTSAADRDAITAALDALEADFDVVASLPFNVLTNPERLAVLDRLETLSRRHPTMGHRLINLLSEQASPVELGGTSLANVLSTRLRVSGTDARRRIAEAEDLGERTAIAGEPLPPRLPNTAAAQAAGTVGAEHVRIIRGFFAQVPGAVDFATRQAAEADLARMAAQFGPEQLRKAADRLAALLDQDGTFTDADRARRRGVTIGRQGPDGMSQISGLLDPGPRHPGCRAGQARGAGDVQSRGPNTPRGWPAVRGGDPGRCPIAGRSATTTPSMPDVENGTAIWAVCCGDCYFGHGADTAADGNDWCRHAQFAILLSVWFRWMHIKRCCGYRAACSALRNLPFGPSRASCLNTPAARNA